MITSLTQDLFRRRIMARINIKNLTLEVAEGAKLADFANTIKEVY